MKRPEKTPAFRGPRGVVLPGSIAEIQYLRLGGIDLFELAADFVDFTDETRFEIDSDHVSSPATRPFFPRCFMEHPVQVTFRGLEPTDALNKAVEDRAYELERYFNKIQTCKVMVESAHRSHRQGNLYHVRVRLTVPGEEIVVSRDPAEHAQNEDMYLAINDAFKETVRRLEDYVRRRRGRVKEHVGAPRGRVIQIFPDEDYGFLEDAQGREIYFHRSSVLDDAFPRLEVGSEVRFAEEPGEKGPQASSVSVSGR